MLSMGLTASWVSRAGVVDKTGQAGKTVLSASTEQKLSSKNEKSIKMSWSVKAVERKSAEVKCGWEARFPRFKAKGIAD
jgi:hypothetical protein